jgi:acetate---CoA ligase (ADP-forming) subunit beta
VSALLKPDVLDILTSSRAAGWVMEPEAKRLLALSGLPVPKFRWAGEADEAVDQAHEVGYPVVAKVVSPRILHKSEWKGVVVGLKTDDALRETFERFSRYDGFAGMLVEEMVQGLELIVGARIDYQFGPVILLGMGGTGVEIYKDTTLRMAPLQERDVRSMVGKLKAHALLEGHRGAEPVNLADLTSMMLAFSRLVMDLQEFIESVDLNPVKCNAQKCVIADARILLVKSGHGSFARFSGT